MAPGPEGSRKGYVNVAVRLNGGGAGKRSFIGTGNDDRGGGLGRVVEVGRVGDSGQVAGSPDDAVCDRHGQLSGGRSGFR